MSNSNPQVKSFINLTYEYHLRKNDKNLLQLQRQLQILSVVSDLSIFEPTSMETLELFMCLEQLLIEGDQKSSISWKVINLLMHISHSSTVRRAMRDEMQLLPVISNYLVSSKLSKDKCHKTLVLIQDLSYGVKIVRLEAWLINFIPFLISLILESEIVHSETETAVIILSNLCRGNAPAISLLKEFTERKILLRSLANLKSSSVTVQLVVSEILLYINSDYAKVGVEQVVHTLDLLFIVAVDGAANEDQNLLQLSKDVFEEFLKQSNIQEEIEKYTKLESVTKNMFGYITEKSNPECVDVTCQLLALIVHLNRGSDSHQANFVFDKILTLLPKREYGSGVHLLFQALVAVVNCAVVSSNIDNVLCVLKDCLTIRDTIQTIKLVDWIMSVIDVIESICNKDVTLHFKLAKSLPPSILSLLLNQLIEGNENDNMVELQYSLKSACDIQYSLALKKRNAVAAANRNLVENISKAVVNILTLVRQLSLQNPEFKLELRQILGNPKIMKFIVYCERSHNMNLVSKSCNILSEESIPGETLNALIEAHAEANIQLQTFPELTESYYHEKPSFNDFSSVRNFTPSISEETIDKFFSKLNGFVEKSELKDVPLTEVMELYEYKLVGLAHNERNLQKALSAADSQIRETRSELMQAKAESSRLRNLLHSWEGRIQELQVEKKQLNTNVIEIQQSARSLRNDLVKDKTVLERKIAGHKLDISNLKQEVDKRTEENSHLQRQIGEAITENNKNQKLIKQSKDDVQELHNKVSKLEEEKKMIRKDVEELEEGKEKLQKLNSSLKKENIDLEMLIRSHEETIAEKENQMDEMSKENATLKKIQDMIHNISSGKV